MLIYEIRCDKCNEVITKGTKIRDVKKYAANCDGVRVDDKYYCEDCGFDLKYLIECPGEAHSNPYIDNCSVCAPRWGYIEAKGN
jgi:hypothetical protein